MDSMMIAWTLAGALSLGAGAAAAQSPIDGTWKVDPKTIKAPSRPVRFALIEGIYECTTCLPPVKVKADGQDQPVTGSAHADTLAVTVVDQRGFRTVAKKGGQPVNEVRWSMSADGKTLTRESSQRQPDGRTRTEKALLGRLEPAPAGAHAASGAWQGTQMLSMSDSLVTFKTAGGVLTMSTPEGATYSAKLDGTVAPVTGDPGTHEVSVQKKGPRTFEELSYRDGHLFLTTVITVDAGGKSAAVRWTHAGNKSTGGYTLRRQ